MHMLTTDTVLTIHGNRGYRGVPLVSVYHHLFDPELMLRAYGKIYRNAGAMTKGSTRETIKRRQARRNPGGTVKAGLLEPQ